MQIKRIVCCTDFSDSADNALNNAVSLAKLNRAHLDLIHVREIVISPFPVVGEAGMVPGSFQSTLPELERLVREKYLPLVDPEVACTVVVREGHPSTEILEYLKQSQADLVVVGSRGLSGMGLVLFGSVSRRIAHKAPCSVLVSRRRRKS
jgi:universal stress protein A